MSDALPTRPAFYVGRDGDLFVLTADGDWHRVSARLVELFNEEIRFEKPLVRMIPFTAEEAAAVNDVAAQIATGLHLSAVARERWGSTLQQPDLTTDLIAVDLWRGITEKTRAS